MQARPDAPVLCAVAAAAFILPEPSPCSSSSSAICRRILSATLSLTVASSSPGPNYFTILGVNGWQDGWSEAGLSWSGMPNLAPLPNGGVISSIGANFVNWLGTDPQPQVRMFNHPRVWLPPGSSVGLRVQNCGPRVLTPLDVAAAEASLRLPPACTMTDQRTPVSSTAGGRPCVTHASRCVGKGGPPSGRHRLHPERSSLRQQPHAAHLPPLPARCVRRHPGGQPGAVTGGVLLGGGASGGAATDAHDPVPMTCEVGRHLGAAWGFTSFGRGAGGIPTAEAGESVLAAHDGISYQQIALHSRQQWHLGAKSLALSWQKMLATSAGWHCLAICSATNGAGLR